MCVFVFARAYFRCFVVLELMSTRIDVGMRTQALAVVFRGFVPSNCMHAHSQRSDQQELTVEHNFLVGEVVLVLRHEDQIGCHTTYIPTSHPHTCTLLEVSFFYCRRHISHCHTRVAFSFPLRRVSLQFLQFFGRVIVQCRFRCFSVLSFDYLEHVGSADSLMGARCSSTKNQFVRKLSGSFVHVEPYVTSAPVNT